MGGIRQSCCPPDRDTVSSPWTPLHPLSGTRTLHTARNHAVLLGGQRGLGMMSPSPKGRCACRLTLCGGDQTGQRSSSSYNHGPPMTIIMTTTVTLSALCFGHAC